MKNIFTIAALALSFTALTAATSEVEKETVTAADEAAETATHKLDEHKEPTEKKVAAVVTDDHHHDAIVVPNKKVKIKRVHASKINLTEANGFTAQLNEKSSCPLSATEPKTLEESGLIVAPAA